MYIKKLNQNSNNSTKKRGFTLVEMVIVAPIVILVIGVFIFAIINMVGAVMASRGSNTLAYNIQQALSQIDQDVSASSGFLAVNNVTIQSPQGFNNDTTNFKNANTDLSIGNVLILNSYATTTNPISSTRSYVYATDKPHACASTLVNQNAKITMNIIYFVKTVNDVSSLWRRVVAPSNYLTAGCSAPWQQPSCVPGYNPVTYPFCKTQDIKLVDGVQASGFNVSYFVSGSTTANVLASDATQSDPMRQAAMDSANTVNVQITAGATMAGRNISQTGSIRSINSNTTYKTQAPLSPVADWLATSQGNHVGNFYDLVTKQHATVTRAGAKTIYDPATQKIYDVPANYLGVNPRSDGKSGSEAVIEEGRTNYLLHSYGDLNSGGLWNGWSIVPSNGSASFSTAQGVYSTTAMRAQVIPTSSGDIPMYSPLTAVGSFAPGDNGTLSFYIKGTIANAASAKAYVIAYDSSGGWLANGPQTSVTPTGTFTQVKATYSSLPSNTSSIRLAFYVATLSSGTLDITIDATQLEKGPFATSYIPTTTAAVTRNADVVTVPTTGWGVASGTVVWASNVSYTATTDPNEVLAPFGMLGTSGLNNKMDPGYWVMYNGFGPNMYDGAGADNSPNGAQSSLFGQHTMALTFTSGTGNVLNYYNGTVSPRTGTLAINRTANASIVYIGSSGSSYFDGPIQRLTVYNSALSSSDVTTVTNAIKDGP